MCRIEKPKKSKRKYCYKIYWFVDNQLYTQYTAIKHSFNKEYVAVNVEQHDRTIPNLPSYCLYKAYPTFKPSHSYRPDHVGIMGFTTLRNAKALATCKQVVVKCLIKETVVGVPHINLSICLYPREHCSPQTSSKYLTPLEIVWKGSEIQ